jgi:erythronate-4-phosphate dehydrogenase
VKLLIDENIPGAREAFTRFGRVQLLPGRAIDAAAVRDADALLVRSVTRVDRALLAGSRVRFVATATAGTDHVRIDELDALGIRFAHAPGSNADSVVDYVLGVLALAFPPPQGLAGRTVGIVGCGQVGARLLARLRALGVPCRVHDPLLTRDIPPESCSLQETLRCDVLSLHVPLTRGGEHATHHLLGAPQLAQLRDEALLVNAARGPVVDNAALLDAMRGRPGLRAALDVWEREPRLDRALLARVLIGTPHIAGYAHDGKLRGARMVYAALRAFLGAGAAPLDPPELCPAAAGVLRAADCGSWQQAVLACYDPRGDDARLRAAMRDEDDGARAAGFDHLRRDYPVRREFSAWRIGAAATAGTTIHAALRAAGFAP